PLPRLSAPASRALAAAGITDLRQLDGTPERDVLALHGVGPSQLGVLRDALSAAGLSLADPLSRPRATGRNDNTAFLETPGSPRQWIEGLPTARRVEDGLRLLELFGEVTGEPPSMWGPSIVGYGTHHYVYDSGREGDTLRVGFSPRASAISLYGLLGAPGADALLATLGPHKTGTGCLYVTTLARIREPVLRELVAAAWAQPD
ncbi:helix-hairpin-helix domain-containing protein, partial [Dietzia sp. B19]